MKNIKYERGICYDLISPFPNCACSLDCVFLDGRFCKLNMRNGIPYELWPTGHLDKNGKVQYAPSQDCLKLTDFYDK